MTLTKTTIYGNTTELSERLTKISQELQEGYVLSTRLRTSKKDGRIWATIKSILAKIHIKLERVDKTDVALKLQQYIEKNKNLFAGENGKTNRELLTKILENVFNVNRNTQKLNEPDQKIQKIFDNCVSLLKAESFSVQTSSLNKPNDLNPTKNNKNELGVKEANVGNKVATELKEQKKEVGEKAKQKQTPGQVRTEENSKKVEKEQISKPIENNKKGEKVNDKVKIIAKKEQKEDHGNTKQKQVKAEEVKKNTEENSKKVGKEQILKPVESVKNDKKGEGANDKDKVKVNQEFKVEDNKTAKQDQTPKEENSKKVETDKKVEKDIKNKKTNDGDQVKPKKEDDQEIKESSSNPELKKALEQAAKNMRAAMDKFKQTSNLYKQQKEQN